MSNDAALEMEPLIGEVLSASTELCASFEVVGRTDAWLQVMKGTLNFAYPLSEDPHPVLDAVLTALPGAAVSAWEAGTYATVLFDPTSPPLVAATADRILGELFKLGDYSIYGAIEDMG